MNIYVYLLNPLTAFDESIYISSVTVTGILSCVSSIHLNSL
jgi:hypothetical protein